MEIYSIVIENNTTIYLLQNVTYKQIVSPIIPHQISPKSILSPIPEKDWGLTA